MLRKVQKIHVILGRSENTFHLLQWLSMGTQVLKHTSNLFFSVYSFYDVVSFVTKLVREEYSLLYISFLTLSMSTLSVVPQRGGGYSIYLPEGCM